MNRRNTRPRTIARRLRPITRACAQPTAHCGGRQPVIPREDFVVNINLRSSKYPSLHRSRATSIERRAVIATTCEDEPEQGDHLCERSHCRWWWPVSIPKFDQIPNIPLLLTQPDIRLPHCQAGFINNQKIFRSLEVVTRKFKVFTIRSSV